MADVFAILSANYKTVGATIPSKAPYVPVDAKLYQGDWTGKYADNKSFKISVSNVTGFRAKATTFLIWLPGAHPNRNIDGRSRPESSGSGIQPAPRLSVARQSLSLTSGKSVGSTAALTSGRSAFGTLRERDRISRSLIRTTS